jgi:hypothetical protein
MQLLHLFHAGVEHRPGTAVGLLKSWIDHSPEHRHDVVTIGPTALRRLATDVGLPVSASIGAPRGLAEMAAAAIRRIIAIRPSADAIVCWSPGTLRVTRVGAARYPVVACLAHRPTAAEARRLARSIQRRRGATVLVCFSPTVAEAAINGGVRNEGLYVVRPGVEASWCDAADRMQLRQQWGVHDAWTPVVTALATPPPAADAERAGLALAMACEAMGNPGSLRQSIRLLCHPMQQSRERARRVLSGIDMPDLVVQDEHAATPWRTLPGCDLALVFGPHGDRLARAWSMAAGRPTIVAPRAGAMDDIQHEQHGLVAKTHEPRDLAHCIKRVLEDRAAAAGFGERAAARAVQRFDPAVMAHRLDEIVHQRLHTHTPEAPRR